MGEGGVPHAARVLAPRFLVAVNLLGIVYLVRSKNFHCSHRCTGRVICPFPGNAELRPTTVVHEADWQGNNPSLAHSWENPRLYAVGVTERMVTGVTHQQDHMHSLMIAWCQAGRNEGIILQILFDARFQHPCGPFG